MAGIEQRLPAGVKHIPEESTSLKEAIDKAVAERLAVNDRTKLTWDPNKIPVAGEAKMIGKELCLSLPYMLIEKKYYIQNMRIYLPNGIEISENDVFEREGGGGPIFSRVTEAMETMADQAAKADPNLCRHCWKFTSTSSAMYLKHMVDIHPDVVADIAKGKPEQRVRPKCERCGKDFQGITAMEFHMWKKHGMEQYRKSAAPEPEPAPVEEPQESEL